jgi:hypothetical protein
VSAVIPCAPQVVKELLGDLLIKLIVVTQLHSKVNRDRNMTSEALHPDPELSPASPELGQYAISLGAT